MKSRGEMADRTLKLRPSPWKWALIGLTFLALAGGIALLYATSPPQEPSDDSLLVVGPLIALFGAGALVSFIMLLPNSVYLQLTPAGFTVRTLLKRKDYRWEEVEEFRPGVFRGTQWVVFTLSPHGKAGRTESRLKSLNKAISGGDDNLPDTYGMSAEDLAELMNGWKEKSESARR